MTYYLQLDYPTSAVAGIPFSWAITNGEPNENYYITTDLPNSERIPATGTFSLDENGEASSDVASFGTFLGTINLSFHFELNGDFNRTIVITPIKLWVPDEILKSIDLNWNFDYLQTEIEKLSIGGSGGNKGGYNLSVGGAISNDFYMKNWSSFHAGTETNLSYKGNLLDSPYGNTAVETSSYIWARGPIFQLDRTYRWNAEFWVRKTSSGTANTASTFMVVSNYNSNVSIIAGDGIDWHYPLNDLHQNTMPIGEWTKYSYTIGPLSDTKDHSANAKFISLGFISNYPTSGVVGNDTLQFAGFSLRPYLVQDKPVAGYIGSVGYRGSRGITGFIGSAGDVGPAGTEPGPVGYRGCVGARGFPGYSGSVGDEGPAGTIPGPQGDQGPVGYRGCEGARGPLGYQGCQGAVGATGSKGPAGDIKGPVGDKGSTGDKGSAGDKGPPGDVKGPVGDKGSVGDKGPAGDKGSTGDKGPAGDVKGPTGDKGPDGNKGATGDKGSTGDKGPNGDQGAAGGIGATGYTGSVGFIGSEGFRGSVGARGVNGYTGCAGDKGPIGDKGIAGSPLPDATTFLSYANGEGYGNEIWVFEGKFFDQGNGYSQITGLYTAPESGYYHVHMNGLTRPDAINAITLWFQVNGSALLQSQFVDYKLNSIVPSPIRMSTIVHLEQGDTIGVFVNDAGGTSTLNGLPRISNFGAFLIGK